MAKRSGKKYPRRNMRGSSDRTPTGAVGQGASEQGTVKSDGSKHAWNDVSWYTKYPNLAIGSGQAQYINVPGMRLDLFANQRVNNQYVPGILSLEWAPSFGDTDDPLNGVNLAGQELYTRVRATYSGNLHADSPDFLVYIGALDSIFAYIGWLKRVYRAISTYSPDNFLLPQAVLVSQLRSGNIDYVTSAIKNLRGNKDNFWTKINELILATGKFKCPAVMDIMNRHYWMSDNVFADANSPKAQLYMYTLRGVYMYKALPIVGDTQGNTAAGLQMVDVPMVTSANQDMVNTLYDFGMSLINALDAWSEGYEISGYLRGAFEGVPNFAVAQLEYHELLTASYSEEVLSQIENFHPIEIFPNSNGFVSGVADNTIQQDVIHNKVVATNKMSYTLASPGMDYRYATYLNSFGSSLGLFTGNVYLNSRADQPSVGDTIVASRMAAAIKDVVVDTSTTNTYNVTITADTGTEIPLRIVLVTAQPSLQGQVWWMMVPPILMLGQASNFASGGNSSAGFIGSILQMESFDWHPICLYANQTGTSPASATAEVTLMGDLHNCAVMTRDQLHAIHRVCIFSELNAFNIM